MSNAPIQPTESRLLIRNGKQAGTNFPLEATDKQIIGRDNSCHIQVLDKGISRNHSLVEHKGDHFLLVDLGSTNGTFVNNKTIISKILIDGDVIRIGQTELTYEESKIAKSSASFVMDEIMENSPNTIMERVDVGHSLVGVSIDDLRPGPGGKPSGGETTANKYLSTIYEVSTLINAEQDQQKLFNAVMDKIMSVFKPDRGFLVMHESNEFNVVVAKDLGSGEQKLSKTILTKTVNDGISVLSGNALLDDQFAGGMSIVTQQIKSVMSAPLESQNKILGAIYLDSLGSVNSFTKSDLDLLTAIGKQAGVAIERALLFEHFMETEKLKQAMEIAQHIQRSLLPSEVPDSFEYDLVGWNRSCDETGGDYYDFFELPENKLAIAVGDVTGHGIGAALLMATARAFLKALACQNRDIVEMICELNALLEKDMEDDKFMTMFYGELDSKTMTLSYVNAGHDAPLLFRKSQNHFEELESTGIPLGMMDDFEYEEGETIQINRGDILVLSTDGITEAMNHGGDQFGVDRLIAVIRQNANKSANQIIGECYNQVEKFCQGAEQRDDLTLVVIKLDPRAR